MVRMVMLLENTTAGECFDKLANPLTFAIRPTRAEMLLAVFAPDLKP